MQSSIAPSSESISADGPVGVNSGTMKAVIHTSYGSVDGVELRDVEKPVIEDHQVRVRVHASSVNPAEWYGVMGTVFARVAGGLRKPKSGAIGADLAGTIEAVGKDVTEFHLGDEVFGTSGHSWAEYAPAREPRLARSPRTCRSRKPPPFRSPR